MTNGEDKTIVELLDEFPLEEQSEEEQTEIIANIPNSEIEKGDDRLNTKTTYLNFQNNKDVVDEKQNLSFENFLTAYETEESKRKTKILHLFLDSLIDMLNHIIFSYQKKYKSLEKLSYLNIDKILENIPLYLIRFQKLLEIIGLGCPENKRKIFSVIEKETKEKLTAFETLINFKFEELYDYFIKNCTIITSGWYIYDLTGIFKTFGDIVKENEDLKEEEISELISLEKFDKMEIDTLNLENEN